MNRLVLVLLMMFAVAPRVQAQRDLTNIPLPDPAAELAAMQIAEGFEVNLFASDPDFSKPIHMNWDAEGRLWIASSQNYPQLKPGAQPTDQIVVLEDTDGDGVADKRTLFADNLMIPTGVLPGDGGVYVANSTELIHLADTNGDGRADVRRTVLSGFGTEDTHHLLHTLRWRPDMRMAMNQSIYIHSHIETPFGIKHLDGGGIWHFDPDTFSLEVLSKGLVNPWGHAIDEFGQSLATDGAGGEGINYPFPGSVFVTSPGATRWLNGLNPGSPKHCGLEFISGSAMPAEMQQVLVTNDFRGQRVCRFKLERQGSGYRSVQLPDLIRSEHVAFRPIDVKMGPDGAIYIADWYNPIIQHGEVDFRDPRRDTEHGRIWRITAKGLPKTPLPRYQAATEQELVDWLGDSAWWIRQFSREELATRDPARVQSAFAAADLQAQPHLPLQPLWYQLATGRLEVGLLDELRQHSEPRIRAAALRVLGEQHRELEQAGGWLAAAVLDDDAQVVLEAVCGLQRVGTLEAVRAVLVAAEAPIKDSSLTFAIWNALRENERVWLPAFEQGLLQVEAPAALDALADAAGSTSVARHLADNLPGQPEASQGRSLQLIAARGDAATLATALRWLLASERTPADRAAMLTGVLQTTAPRQMVPAEVADWLPAILAVQRLGEDSTAPLLSALAVAAEQWKVATALPVLNKWLDGDMASLQPAVTTATLSAVAELGGEEGRRRVEELASREALPLPTRLAAIAAESRFAPQAAALQLVKLYAVPVDLSDSDAGQDASAGDSDTWNGADNTVRVLLSRQAGGDALREALASLPKSPWDPNRARELIAAVRGSSQASDELIAAIVAASGLDHAGWKLTPASSARWMTMVRESGDPASGQEIYRREKLQCVQCHAIGKSGVEIGPNLVSLGGSSQLDYIVESVLEPAAKAKEGYQTLSVLLDSGEIVNGLQKSRTDEVIQLLLADGTLKSISVAAIEDVREGKSLMPAGLVDQLSERELVDLLAFLSQLGRNPEYTVDTRNWVRNWQVLEWNEATHRRFNRSSFDSVANQEPSQVWRLLTTCVDGTAPLPAGNAYVPHAGVPPTVFIRCTLKCTQAGTVRLQFTQPLENLLLWLDGEAKPLPEPDQEFELSAGDHQLILGVRIEQIEGGLGCEIEAVDAVVEIP